MGYRRRPRGTASGPCRYGCPLFSRRPAVGCRQLPVCLLGRSTDARLKRLHRIESWSAVFYCAAAFLLFYTHELRDWLAFTLAGAAIQIITSIAIPMREAKLARGEADSRK